MAAPTRNLSRLSSYSFIDHLAPTRNLSRLSSYSFIDLAPTRNLLSSFCLLSFQIREVVQVWTMDWRGRHLVSNVPPRTRVTTRSLILSIPDILRSNYDNRATANLSMRLSSLQLPVSLQLEIIARVRNLIVSGYVRDTGTSVNVTVHAITNTTLHQPIENEYEVSGIDDSMIYDAIETDEDDHHWGFGAVPATESCIESLEKVRFEESESESKQTQCSICLEEFEGGSEVTRLPCLHVYHGDCITRWLEKSHKCPLCRFSLPRKS